MKNYLLLFAFAVCSFSGFSQTTDTTFLTVSQEKGALEKQQFMEPYNLVFGSLQRTQLLVKLNLIPVLLPLGDYVFDEDILYSSSILEDFSLIPRADLMLEWKVAPAFSINATGIVSTRGSAYFKGQHLGIGWRVEPRWYYDMPGKIRSGESANNVSGNYISAEYQTFSQRDNDRKPSAYFMDYQFQSVSLRYGLQRRLFRYGFIDASIGAGYQWATYHSADEFRQTALTDRGLFLETRIAAGLALGSPRAGKPGGALCDVLRCFQEDRHLWKIGIAKALKINQSGLTTNPKVSYEQKLGNSAFSVETEAELFLSTYPDLGEKLEVRKYGAGLNVQPRWYFLQKRRVAKGKSGNNLSGVFAGIMGGYRHTERTSEVIFNDDHGNTFYVAPHLGVQHRLFQHGFVQFKFGVLYDVGFTVRHNSFPDPESFLSELQVGFAF